MGGRRYFGVIGPKKNKEVEPSVQIVRVENPINQIMKKENELLKQPWLIAKETNFIKVIEKEPGEIHKGFVGMTNVGKSSLMNTLLSSNEKTGPRKTTITPKKVEKINNVVIWDMPGFDKGFNYLANAIHYLKDLDVIYVLYNGQIEDIENLLKTIWMMGKIPKLVKTKCESDPKEQAYDGIEYDREDLKKLSQIEHEIFASSREKNYEPNEKLLLDLIKH